MARVTLVSSSEYHFYMYLIICRLLANGQTSILPSSKSAGVKTGQFGTDPLDAYLPTPPAGTVVLFDATPESEAEWILHEIVDSHETVQIHGRTTDAERAGQITHTEYEQSVILDDTGEWESRITTRSEYLQEQTDPPTEPTVWIIDGVMRIRDECDGPEIGLVIDKLRDAAHHADGYVFIYAPTLSLHDESQAIPHQIVQQSDVIADVRLNRGANATDQEFYISQATYAPPMRAHRRLRFENNTVGIDTTRDIS